MRGSPFVVPQVSLQGMYDCMARLFRLWSASGLLKRPKLHWLMHLVDRTAENGNPTYYACWADEGLNRVFGNLGRQARRQDWEVRILMYFEVSKDHVATRWRFWRLPLRRRHAV